MLGWGRLKSYKRDRPLERSTLWMGAQYRMLARNGLAAAAAFPLSRDQRTWLGCGL